MSIQTAIIRRVPPWLFVQLSALQHRSPLARPFVRAASALMGTRRGRIPRGLARGLHIDCGPSVLGYLVGTAEPQVQEILPTLVHPGETVYDIGANVGFFTLGLARLVGPEGLVLAFEPMELNAATLRRNVAQNGLSNVRVVQIAVGEAHGQEQLLFGGGSTVAKLAHTGKRADTSGGAPVEVDSLDHLWASGLASAPQFVKMDIEGAEIAALRGMRRLLLAERPLVLCELHDTHTGVAAILGEMSYSCFCVEDPHLTKSQMHEMHWNAHIVAFPEERADALGEVRNRLLRKA